MVAAQETSLRKLLEGAKQYQVPLYQRTYSWEQSQLKRLWQDVVQLAEDIRDDASARTSSAHWCWRRVRSTTPQRCRPTSSWTASSA